LHELSDDGQAQAGAAACRAPRQLRERLEQIQAFLVTDTRSGVFHLKQQMVLHVVLCAQPYGYAALIGKLHGVAHQVHQDLAQARLIALDVMRKAGRRVKL
jgi:hypothetical protein